MKVAGLSLLVAGWIIVVATAPLLASPGSRDAFVLAGIVVEVLALVLLFRSHLPRPEERA